MKSIRLAGLCVAVLCSAMVASAAVKEPKDA
jgi:hypothetical protein